MGCRGVDDGQSSATVASPAFCGLDVAHGHLIHCRNKLQPPGRQPERIIAAWVLGSTRRRTRQQDVGDGDTQGFVSRLRTDGSRIFVPGTLSVISKTMRERVPGAMVSADTPDDRGI